jgi:hypothetical protein
VRDDDPEEGLMSDKTPFDTACERILGVAVKATLAGEVPVVLRGLRPDAREWMLGALMQELEETPDGKHKQALLEVQQILKVGV